MTTEDERRQAVLGTKTAAGDGTDPGTTQRWEWDVSDLSEFLLARIAEDEAVARLAPPRAEREIRSADDGWIDVPNSRVLAECEAKRRIVELAAGEARSAAAIDEEFGDQGGRLYDTADATRDVLRLLALPYANHPGWREEWRP